MYRIAQTSREKPVASLDPDQRQYEISRIVDILFSDD
jgi:hypothetical protein